MRDGSTLELPAARRPPNTTGPTSPATIQSIVSHLPGLQHHTIQPYTSTRVRDAISLGYQSTVFAGIIVAAYVYGEKRRRRLGQRGADDVKGYLPGK